MKKVWLVLGSLAIGVVLAACVPLMETPVPTQDVNAAVQTAVAEALWTAPQTPTPVIDATIQPGIKATITPQPAPTPMPVPPATSLPTAISLPTATPLPLRLLSPFPLQLPQPLARVDLSASGRRTTPPPSRKLRLN